MRSQGRWKEAEGLDVQVVETRKKVLGEEHPDMLNSLAFTWKGDGQYVEALKLVKKFMPSRTRILGADHPYALSSFNTLLGWQRTDEDPGCNDIIKTSRN